MALIKQQNKRKIKIQQKQLEWYRVHKKPLSIMMEIIKNLQMEYIYIWIYEVSLITELIKIQQQKTINLKIWKF